MKMPESDKIVYWHYGSKEVVWHLYPSCSKLGTAAIDGTLCKGNVETAINTGRQMVCPVCKAKFDSRQKDENANTVRAPVPPHEPKKAEIETTKATPEIITPAPKKSASMVQRSTAWIMSIAFAVLTWFCCYGYYDDQYNIGYSDGVRASSQNYDAGYADGEKDGAEKAKRTWYDNGYSTGYSVGYTAGIDDYKKAQSEKSSSNYYSNSQNTYQEPATSNSYTVYITATGSKYHSYGCSYLRDSCYPIDVNDAIARGYTACSRCNP